ncbi:MAG: hydrogenase maturation protease, partial [Cytophagaceae bacterium]|nr:hydrogenase maturation protease [Gemmatimonadaceae bacterium]
LLDVGTGGIRLAQELLTPYDRLIVVDAVVRGGTPGTIYTLTIDAVAPTREIDLHTAIPSRALEVAQALGPLPPQRFLVGCEPASVDELTLELSPLVAAAIPRAIEAIEQLLLPVPAPGASIGHEDELLELLYWFEGEGFTGSATLEGIARFTTIEPLVVERTLERLIARGDIREEPEGGTEYRLTATGRHEAARRFAAEFAPLLGQGHGECNDPNCDCHTTGNPADCHTHHTH